MRCDTPEPPYQWDGAIGICKKVYGMTGDISSELKDDHAVHNRRLLEQTLQAFHTPMQPRVKKVRTNPSKPRVHRGCAMPASGDAMPASGGAMPASGGAKRKGIPNERVKCNTDELSAFVKKVRFLASDGGNSERRALFMLAEQYFPNAHFVVEDPAHGLRIAMTKPLQLESCFKEVQGELFNKQHAFIPDIQNSGKWKAMLEGIQKTTMRIPGLQRDGVINVVLKHLAFAKARMDSTADPIAKLCLMFMPIAYLLSFIAADERCAGSQRARAREVPAKFQPMFCIGAAASADWG